MLGSEADLGANLAVVVSLAGIAVAAIGLLGLAAPIQLTKLLANWHILTGLPITFGLRIGFGTLFLFAAPYCRLPDLVRLLGVLELLWAAVLMVLGAARLQRFVEWWLKRPLSFVRSWCLAVVTFGILLVSAGA